MTTKKISKSGDLDTSFADGGRLIIMTPGNFHNDLSGLTENSKGEVLIYGTYIRQTPATAQAGVARVKEAGEIDLAFGDLQDGVSTAPQEISTGDIRSLAFKRDHGFFVCYTSQNLTPLLEYDSDGKLLGRPQFIEGQSFPYPQLLAVEDDKFLVAGSDDRNGLLYRRNPDGSADTSFGDQGKILFVPGSSYVGISHIAKSAEHSAIYISGYRGNYGFITRLHANGQPDERFADAGVYTATPNNAPYSECKKTVELPNGKVLVLISATTRDVPINICYVAQLLESGIEDPDFNEGNVLIVAADAVSEDIALQPDGKFLVLYRTPVNGNQLARFLPDGTLDSGFGSGGVVFLDLVDISSMAKKVIIQPTGKILVSARHGASGTFLTRLNP